MIMLSVLILMSAAPPVAFVQGPILGSWQVVSSRCPGVCAMSAAESAEWHGTIARYTASVARFGGDSCATPSYSRRRLTDREFIRGFRTSLRSIGITANSVDVIEVGCNGRGTKPGSFLIIKDPGHILTVWDGVFFEMVPLATFSPTSERPNKRLKLPGPVAFPPLGAAKTS